MQDKMPETHEAIVSADKLSQENFSGHGSALAQVYNHMIMPLANARDKYTQVYLGRPRFCISLPTQTRRHVAFRNRRGHTHAGDAGRARNSIYSALAVPSCSHPQDRTKELVRCERWRR